MKVEAILDYKLKKLLGTEKYETVLEDDKKFILTQSATKIKNYCHIQRIPKDANYIWADMAIELFKDLDPTLWEESKETEMGKMINSIRTGDTTINLDKQLYNSLDNDAILVAFSKQLQNFRKPRLGCGCAGKY